MASSDTFRPIIPENIPDELKKLNQFTVWISKKEKGTSKPEKIPLYLPKGETKARYASIDKPETWMSFEDAINLFNSSTKYKGLQIALPEDTADSDKLVGIDLDKALLDDGSIKPEIKEIISSFNSYTEFSPTLGQDGGIRILCKGKFPRDSGVHKGDFEIYQENKFLTLTGNLASETPNTINNAQEAIDAFRAKHFKPLSVINDSELPLTSEKFTDEEIMTYIENSKIGNQFKELYSDGIKEGDDHSAKDLDLCKMITFWTQDCEQIDRIFRGSKLYRGKWDKRHFSNGDTYGQGTIKCALKTRKKVYKPQIALSGFNAQVGFYTVNKEGIFKTITPKEGKPYDIKISSTPCVLTAIGSNIDTREIHYKLKIKDNLNHEKTVWRGTKGLMKRQDVLELLCYGMHFKESNVSDIIDYFDKFIIQHKEDLPTEIVASRCGWKNNFSTFVIGNYSISEDGVKETLQVDNTATVFYQQKGNVKEFAHSANKLLKYPAVRFKAYGGCAAILLKPLDVSSHVIDQNCLSGQLKSDSNYLVAAMFGNPIKLQLDSDSTKIGITKVAEYCTDLPMFVDETSKAPEHINKLIYTIANGNSRVKSNSNQGLEISENYSTVLLTTGESPLLTGNARGGEDARVIPLTEGVGEIISANEIHSIEIAIKNNYGHVVFVFLQTLFSEKDSIMDVYKAFFEALPTVEDITSNRVKKYYACIATAGYLLEKVFAQIGIDPADPLEVCTAFFEKNVTNTTIVPDHIKMLKIAYSWYTANEAHFGDDGSKEVEDSKKDLLEKYGWIRTVKGEETINFVSETLKGQIIKVVGKDGASRYESALNEWKNLRIINIRTRKNSKTEKLEILKTCQIRVKGKPVTVIQIPLRNFYEHLGLEDSDQPENSAKAEPKILSQNVSQELTIFEPKDDSEFAALIQEGI